MRLYQYRQLVHKVDRTISCTCIFFFLIMSLVCFIWFYFVIETWTCVGDGAVTVMLWSFVFAFKEEKFVF